MGHSPRSKGGAARTTSPREVSEAKEFAAAAEPEGIGSREAAGCARDDFAETPTYASSYADAGERPGRAVPSNGSTARRAHRMRAVGIFPGDESTPMLAAVRPRCVAGSEWGSRCCLDAAPLDGEPYRKEGPRGCRKVHKNLVMVPSSRRRYFVVLDPAKGV